MLFVYWVYEAHLFEPTGMQILVQTLALTRALRLRGVLEEFRVELRMSMQNVSPMQALTSGPLNLPHPMFGPHWYRVVKRSV
jgi:hypothetical protein